MEKQRFSAWWIILPVIGCVGVLCIGVLGVGGYFFLQNWNPPVAVRPSPTSMPTPVPVPVHTPVVPTAGAVTESASPTQAPAASPPGLTGNQRLDGHSLYDDFSSDALDWPLFDDGITILKYENQAYSFQITEPDYVDWAYLPVDFIPYEINFDVQGLSGPQEGTFGVFCQFQDADNYYYAEFDLEEGRYILGEVVNGEDISLTKQNTPGQYWQDTSRLQSPESVNRIGVSCYLDLITLFINEEWVDEVKVTQPFDNPGEAAFFLYTFDFAGPQGYKVFFDNVEAYQPMQ